MAAVCTIGQLDSLWLQEEVRARNVPAPWHIPSPNDPQERAKIENQKLHSDNQLLKNQLTEIQQQLDTKK